MNDFISTFLGRDDIRVEITDNDYYLLKRGETTADNLSDGEKMAIAFSYFMVSLKSVEENGHLQDSIIFIDDPISSLDANHIAQVSSLINTFFFSKDSNGKIEFKVNQLFISTHSFEFYNFLKDANNLRKRSSLYMIKQRKDSGSSLSKLPKSFSKFNSEYVYLFDSIYQFKTNNYNEDQAYSMPNILRRFLEIYTLIKLPGSNDQIDNRVKILCGGVNELKILHNFSHFTSFERATKHNELILRLPDLIEDLFVLLSKDPSHLQSLYEGICVKDHV